MNFRPVRVSYRLVIIQVEVDPAPFRNLQNSKDLGDICPFVHVGTSSGCRIVSSFGEGGLRSDGAHVGNSAVLLVSSVAAKHMNSRTVRYS